MCEGESPMMASCLDLESKRKIHWEAEGLRCQPRNLSGNKIALGQGEEGEEGPSQDTARHRAAAEKLEEEAGGTEQRRASSK